MITRLYYPVAICLAVALVLASNAGSGGFQRLAARSSAETRTELAMKGLMERLTLGLYKGGAVARDELRAVRATAETYQRWAAIGSWLLLGISAAFLVWFTVLHYRSPRRVNLRRLLLHLAGVSAVFLAVGLTAPILSLAVSQQVPVLGDVVLSYEVKSVVGMVWTLLWQGNLLLGFVLLIFSIMTPLAKLGLSFVALSISSGCWRGRALGLIQRLGKWSMVDVFVVAVTVALLAGAGQGNTDASMGQGMVFFTTYALISLILGPMLLRLHRKDDRSTNRQEGD